MFGPLTPGTLIVTAAAVLLILVSISTPILKNFYFLSAEIQATVSSITLDGNIKLGVFGYCIVLGGQSACSPVTLGYALDPNSLLSLPETTNIGISRTVLKNLTYVLILHPIAAGLAALAAISAAISHIREFSRTCWTSFFASLATTVATLAFVFDIVAFSIAKSKIVEAETNSVGTNAQLGINVWLTLAALVCLASSSCFFCFGRCLIRKRRESQRDADQLRPIADQNFSQQMRYDANEAEKAREHKQAPMAFTGLPAFAEYGNEHVRHEEIPLNRLDIDEERYSDHHTLLTPGPMPGRYTSSASNESLTGVGVGYGRRPPVDQSMPAASLYSQPSFSQPHPSQQASYQRSGQPPSQPSRQPSHSSYGQQQPQSLHPSYYRQPEVDPRLVPHNGTRQGSEGSGYFETPPRSTRNDGASSRAVYPQAMLPDQNMWNERQPPDEGYYDSQRPAPEAFPAMDMHPTHARSIEYVPQQADDTLGALPLPGQNRPPGRQLSVQSGYYQPAQPRQMQQDIGPSYGQGPYVAEPEEEYGAGDHRDRDDAQWQGSRQIPGDLNQQSHHQAPYSNYSVNSAAEQGAGTYQPEDVYGGVTAPASPRRRLPSVPAPPPHSQADDHDFTADYKPPFPTATPPPGYQ